MNAQLTQLQKSVDSLKFELMNSKADLKEVKTILKNRTAPSCKNGKKEAELDIKASGWFW
jgi:uncharacterized coiled-coil DUF342 family protein